LRIAKKAQPSDMWSDLF